MESEDQDAAGMGGALGRAPPCGRLWGCAQSPRDAKESCCPFRAGFASHLETPLPPQPTMRFHPITPGLAACTHTGGYKFHWRRKGKGGYFSLAKGLNTQIISLKCRLRGLFTGS